jgi:hypothetical protein
VPAGFSPSRWTPVSQSNSGSGSAASPFTITTAVTNGVGLDVTQVDSYVEGQESYRTDVTLHNTTAAPMPVILYRAGDCYLADSDVGFGRVDGSAPTCVAVDPTTHAAGTRVEQLLPLTGGSDYVEDYYGTVWSDVHSGAPLPNTCACSTAIDNGMGLSWSATLAPGASASFAHLTTFSPTGQVPVQVDIQADASTAIASSTDGYTVTMTNDNATPATIDSVATQLPQGFSYQTGTTTGATTADPQINGQTMTWSGPFTIPAHGTVTYHYDVTVASTDGHYESSVDGASSTATVANSLDTAPIDVAAVQPLPAFPVKGLPIAGLIVVAAAGVVVWRRRRSRTQHTA